MEIALLHIEGKGWNTGANVFVGDAAKDRAYQWGARIALEDLRDAAHSSSFYEEAYVEEITWSDWRFRRTSDNIRELSKRELEKMQLVPLDNVIDLDWLDYYPVVEEDNTGELIVVGVLSVDDDLTPYDLVDGAFLVLRE